jgi:hypothetical protein
MAQEPLLRHESLAERLIRESMEAGEFEGLPGEGKPLPGAGQPDDDLWWVRAWLERSNVGRVAGTRRYQAPDDD